jgi:hypothetical protein
MVYFNEMQRWTIVVFLLGFPFDPDDLGTMVHRKSVDFHRMTRCYVLENKALHRTTMITSDPEHYVSY